MVGWIFQLLVVSYGWLYFSTISCFLLLVGFLCFWQEKDHCPGAFDGWTVLLNCDKVKDENFKRLLEAGGANVLPHK